MVICPQEKFSILGIQLDLIVLSMRLESLNGILSWPLHKQESLGQLNLVVNSSNHNWVAAADLVTLAFMDIDLVAHLRC